MRLLIALFLCSTTSLLSWEHAEWLNSVENRKDGDPVAWLRGQMNPNHDKQPAIALQEDCSSCVKDKILDVGDPKLFVFISFSVPDNIWLSLSHEMAKYQAVFVLRGLPNNSFQSFAKNIARLKEKGMDVPVQIHPDLFKDYAIDKVPTFVFSDQTTTHQIAGAVSLDYALEQIGQEVKGLKKLITKNQTGFQLQ